MMRVLALLLPVLFATSAMSPDQVSFRVIDRMGPTEVSEVTTLYVGLVPAGHFRLDAAHRLGTVVVSVPRAGAYRYGLCGRVVTQAAGAAPVTHRVDTTGTLVHVDGRVFEALTQNFKRFYLADETPGRAPTPVRIEQGRGCAPEISMR